MAKKILKYSDANDVVQLGSNIWDDGDSYDVYTYGGDDKLTFFVDGALWVNAGSGNDDIYQRFGQQHDLWRRRQ